MRANVTITTVFFSLVMFGGAIGSAEAAQTNAPKLTQSPIKSEVIASGLSHAWALQFLPDGRMLVTERPGRMRLVSKDGKLSEPVAGVPKVAAEGQGGLLDVALAPDFKDSGVLYFSFSEPRAGETNGTSVAKAKLVLDGESGKLENVQIIFRQEPAFKSTFHFGSRIVFAKDGSLFVTLGERNFARAEAQNPANTIGKIVHITADGKPAGPSPAGAKWEPHVFSIGHRNVQGAVLDPATGKLWTVEHGAKGGDELNHPESGKNYGWPVITYGRDYSGAKVGEGTAKEGLEQPVYFWDPSIATSGLMIYTGSLFPNWQGNFLVGSLKFGQVQRLVLKDGEVTGVEEIQAGIDQRVRDVRQGPDGAVYVVTDDEDGRIIRLSPGSKG